MQSSSLAWRVLIAVALLVGFYGFALAIILLLLFIPFAQWQFLHSWNLRIAFFCVVGAILIGAAIVPRPDQFVPPGPRLTAKDHPALFARLAETAKAVGQAMPVEVYLIFDLNAWVTERGGVMGFGSRRVMGLGLPLLQILSISELRAVLAHEFGHYYGGDTRLGPWIYKTRGAIGRTLASLEGHSQALQTVFLAYGRLFLSITQAISRQQEYSADALAARTFGVDPLVQGLRTIHGAGPAFVAYLNQEFGPVLNAGYRPRFAEGFAQFVKVPHIASRIAGILEEEVKTAKAEPYDSHPPLRDRLAKLATFPASKALVLYAPAISLLQNVPELEKQLLATATHKVGIRDLPSIEWDDVGRAVYLPSYRDILNEHAAVLVGITPVMLPETATSKVFANYLAAKGKLAANSETATDQSLEFGNAIVGAALVNLLTQRGWLMQAQPGIPVTLCQGEQSVQPFTILPSLIDHSLTAEAWREQCKSLDIADVDLGSIPLAEKQEKKES